MTSLGLNNRALANGEKPTRQLHLEQSKLGMYCLLKLFCLNIIIFNVLTIYSSVI